MSDLLTEALAGRARTPGGARRCKLGRLLDEVPEHNRTTILNYLYDDAVSDADLARMLAQGGKRVAASLCSLHRTGSCICDSRADDEPALRR